MATAAPPGAAAAAAAAAAPPPAPPSQYQPNRPTGPMTKIPPFNPNLFPPPTTSSYGSTSGADPSKPLWLMDDRGIDAWVRSGNSLFPKKRAPHAANGAAAATAKPTDVELQKKKEGDDLYVKNVAAANVLLRNLTKALRSASAPSASYAGSGAAKAGGEPAAKRAKVEHATGASSGAARHPPNADIYNILDPSFSRGEDVVHLPGSILTRLTQGGLTNALAGVAGGVVDVETGKALPAKLSSEDGRGKGGGDAAGKGKKEAPASAAAAGDGRPIPTASDLTLPHLLLRSRRLQSAISSRVHLDMLSTTPTRIVEMLCGPEVTTYEINSIRRRIYDTVVLGRGTGSSAAMEGLEGADGMAVAARTGVHDIEKWKKCKICGNNDQSLFVLDRKNGDLICTSCGTVATSSLMHEGSAYRKFEGEADRNHHGDNPNPLYSNAHNMSTTLGGMGFQTGAGIGGYGSGPRGGGGIENVLRNAHAYTEMNISQFGKGEKKTRTGYKDRQKKDAFVQMNHVGDALNLHEAVVQRAKELFAGFRDDRELVQQFKGVIAACLCEAFDQLSRDGRQILRQRAGDAGVGDGGDDDADDGVGPSDGGNKIVNARASRRNDLHSASLAGRGGILIGTPNKVKEEGGKKGGDGGAGASGGGGSSPASSAASSVETKPAAIWDLDDCRTWLLEASRSIARQWVEQRKAAGEEGQKQNDDDGDKLGAATAAAGGGGAGGKSKAAAALAAIPKGSIDELEGKLVEHTLALCVLLESEVSGGNKGAASGGASAGRGRKVVTPRAADMGRLGIKWQHAHERGSGGRGGVGNSGNRPGGRGVGGGRGRGSGRGGGGGGGGRTAGQILILKTSKKLTIAIKDPVAGEAFHRELRALLGRQEAHKKKELRDEAAMQRFKQMKRKPWLQARAQL